MMKSPSNHYIVAFPKERKVGSLFLPTHLGEEEGLFAPEVGRVVGLPMKFTNKMAIPCSAFGESMTVKDIEHSFSNIKLGDQVFCSYLATADEDKHIMDDGDDMIYAVPAHLLIAIVNGEELIPTADKVIVIPAEKQLSQIVKGIEGKDYGMGTIAFNCDGFTKGQRVVYLEKFSYEFKFKNQAYEAVYSSEVYATIENK
jgi:hypothetical protein